MVEDFEAPALYMEIAFYLQADIYMYISGWISFVRGSVGVKYFFSRFKDADSSEDHIEFS